MKKTLYLILFTCGLAIAPALSHDALASEAWRAPFDTSTATAGSTDSALALADVLRLVATKNPTLASLRFERVAAAGELRQAGLWSNPELEVEVEEFGWDAPGFDESEITVSLAQEFEFFGQRGARKELARAELNATDFETQVVAFDLYLEVKRRYHGLAHAQHQLELTQTTVQLAHDIVENIDSRIQKGAALQSELLLARLEAQRAQLALEQAQQERTAAEANLTALWGGGPGGITVMPQAEPDAGNLLTNIAPLEQAVYSTREIVELRQFSAITRAEQKLAAAEARPSIGLSGGYKHLKAESSNSFLFGISLPLPLFDKNQGTRESLEARARAIDYQIERERLEATAAIGVNVTQLRQLLRQHETLDTVLVPTAEEAYESLRRLYDAGRLPYTQLLEAERSLNELRFEHNDMLLAIQEQIIALESLTGIFLRTDKENQ